MNRKKIFGAAIVAAIVLASGWNISRSMNETTLSDMALENVEALAQESTSFYCLYPCGKHPGNECRSNNGTCVYTCSTATYC